MLFSITWEKPEPVPTLQPLSLLAKLSENNGFGVGVIAGEGVVPVVEWTVGVEVLVLLLPPGFSLVRAKIPPPTNTRSKKRIPTIKPTFGPLLG